MEGLIRKLRNKFVGKKVLIMGLGLQGGGVGLVKFFAQLDAIVKVTDLKTEKQLKPSLKLIKNFGVEYKLRGHDLKDFLEADYIFKGPSVSWSNYFIVEALKRKIPVEVEASFFASVCPVPIIGVTGTRGKSTTSMMILEVLKKQAKKAYLAGNFSGVSTIELLDKLKKGDLVILELSSWALSGFHRKKISPHIAVFTNLYSDHLNYYASIKEYLQDKTAIYSYQSSDDFLIANKRLENEVKKANPKSKIVYFTKADFSSKLKYLKGEHNLENAAAALLVSRVLRLDENKSRAVISNFKGVPYRQDLIGEIDNIAFVNDTTSTTPVAATYAIDAFSDRSIILLLGGNDKKLPFGDLLKSLKRVEKIILLPGTFTDKIRPILTELYPKKITNTFEDLKAAVRQAVREAKKLSKKSYILFSPAATSFSLFENEFQRGEEFNKVAKQIIAKK